MKVNRFAFWERPTYPYNIAEIVYPQREERSEPDGVHLTVFPFQYAIEKPKINFY